MNHAEIQEVAEQAGFGRATYDYWDELVVFAALVAAKEREECAKLIEEFPHWIGKTAKREISDAIRARGQ